MLGCQLLGLLFTDYGSGTYSQATPTLLNACITGCEEFTRNMFVSSVISYLEVSSRVYFVAGDKCARLQCDIEAKRVALQS